MRIRSIITALGRELLLLTLALVLPVALEIGRVDHLDAGARVAVVFILLWGFAWAGFLVFRGVCG